MTHLMRQFPAAFRVSRPSFCGSVSTIARIGLAMLACVPYSALAQDAAPEEPSQNAAAYYRRAAEGIDHLPDDDRALIESVVRLQLTSLYSRPSSRTKPSSSRSKPPSPWGEPASSWSDRKLVYFSGAVPTDERARGTVARLNGPLRLFRQGADSPRCDWGWVYQGEADNADRPQHTALRKLVGNVVFRARYRWQVGKQREAIEDLQSLKSFARHVGSGGKTGLVDVVLQFNVERVVVFTVSQWLVDSDTAKILEGVAVVPSRPAGNLAKNGLLMETESNLPWARRLLDSSNLTPEQRQRRDKTPYGTIPFGELIERFTEESLLEQIEQAHKHYGEVGRLLDLPVDEFQRRFDDYVDHLYRTGNVFSIIGIARCPGIVRAYYDVRELRVRWAMLDTATDIHQSGLEALEQHTDPFGNGPFEYGSSDDGFVLRSRLIVNGTPVTMRFKARQRTP